MSELQNLANNQEEQNKKVQMIKDIEQAMLKENKLITVQKQVKVEDQNQIVTFNVQKDGKRYKDLQANSDLESQIIFSSLSLNKSQDDIYKLIGDTDFNKRIDLTNELLFKLFGKKEPKDVRDVILVRSMIIIQQMAQKIMDIQENLEITNNFNAKVKNALVANLTENLQLTEYLTTLNPRNTNMEILSLKSQLGQISNKIDKKDNIKEEIDKAVENLNRQVSNNFNVAQSNMSLNIDKVIQEKLRNVNNMEIDSDISNITSSIEQMKNQIARNVNDIKILKEQLNNNVRVNNNEHKTIESKIQMYTRDNDARVEKVENLAAQNFEQICSLISGEGLTVKGRNTPKIDNIKSSLEAKIVQMKNEINDSIAEINRQLNEKYNESQNALNDNINKIKEQMNEEREKNKKLNQSADESNKERNKKLQKELQDEIQKKAKDLNERIDAIENNADKKSTDSKDSKKEKIKINKDNIEKVNKVVKNLVEAQKKLENNSENQKSLLDKLNEDKGKHYTNLNKEIINIKTEIGKLKESVMEKKELEKIKETFDKDKSETTDLINNKFEEIKKMLEASKKKSKKEKEPLEEIKNQIDKTIEENKLKTENQKTNEELKIIRDKLEEYTGVTAKAIHDNLFKQISENKAEIEKINATMAICLIFKEEIKDKKEQDNYVFEKKKTKEWKDLNLKERLDNLVREKKSFMDGYKEKVKEIETIKNKIKAAEANIANLDNTTRGIKIQLKLNKDTKSKKEVIASRFNQIKDSFQSTNNEIINEINNKEDNKEDEIQTNMNILNQNKIEELLGLLDSIKQVCNMDIMDRNQTTDLITKMTEIYVDENKLSEALSEFRLDLEKQENDNNGINNNNKTEIPKKEKRNDIPEQYIKLLEELNKGKVIDSINRVQNTINMYKNQTIEKINEITKRTNENTQKIQTNTEQIKKCNERMELQGSKIREIKLQLVDKKNVYVKKSLSNNVSNKSISLDNMLKVNDKEKKEENSSFTIENNIDEDNEEKLEFESLITNGRNNNEADKYEININNDIKQKINDNIILNYKLSTKNLNMPNKLWLKLSVFQKKLFWNKRNNFIQQQKEKIFNEFKDENVIKEKLEMLKYYEDKIPILNEQNKIISYETKKEYNFRRDQNKPNFINRGFYRKRKRINNRVHYNDRNTNINTIRNNDFKRNRNTQNNNTNRINNNYKVRFNRNNNKFRNNSNNFRNNNKNTNSGSNFKNNGESYQKKIPRNNSRQINSRMRNNNGNNKQTFRKKQIYQKPKIMTKRRNITKRNNNNRGNRRFNNNNQN